MKSYNKTTEYVLGKKKSRSVKVGVLKEIVFAPAVVERIIKKNILYRSTGFKWVREGLIRVQSGYFSGAACNNRGGNFVRKINGCWMIE